jgi:hypothetical protein
VKSAGIERSLKTQSNFMVTDLEHQKPQLISPVDEALRHVSPTERHAYDIHIIEQHDNLDVDLQARLFDFYLRGISLATLAKILPGDVTLGSIVYAYAHFGWYQKRQEYLEQRNNAIKDALQQSIQDSVECTTLMLSTAHQELSTKLHKAIISNDFSLLENWQIRDIKTLKQWVEILKSWKDLMNSNTPTRETSTERQEEDKKLTVNSNNAASLLEFLNQSKK